MRIQQFSGDLALLIRAALGNGLPSQFGLQNKKRRCDMPGNYGTILITVGSLACFGAFGWFFESATEQSDSNDDSVPEDIVQQQRAGVYMVAVIVTMCASIVSAIA